jgi:hypothetical protein
MMEAPVVEEKPHSNIEIGYVSADRVAEEEEEEEVKVEVEVEVEVDTRFTFMDIKSEMEVCS